MNADPKTTAVIMAALGEFTEAYSSGDCNRVMTAYAPDDDVVAIGPAVGETWVGRAAISSAYEREFKNFPNSAIELRWVSISSAQKVAWVASDCKAHVTVDHKVLLLEGRFSAIFENRSDRWLIVQSHFSYPAAL